MVVGTSHHVSKPFVDGAGLPDDTWYAADLSFKWALTNVASATSVDVEHIFSRGRLLLSHTRNRMTAQTTRAVICLGAWSRLGLVKDDDVKAVTAQTDDLEDEEDDGWEIIQLLLDRED